jgi:imidazole glycerol-phosphate synthase subunit HisF
MKGRFEPIPSIDLLGGEVVRLTRGRFDSVVRYGDPEAIARSWNAPAGTPLHVVDLDGARRGEATHFPVVERLARLGFFVQVGGGVRSAADARRWIAAGAEKVVTGTVAANEPERLAAIVAAAGSGKVIAAVDLAGSTVRTDGWTRDADVTVETLLRTVEDLGICEMLVTAIERDGTLGGPDLELYRSLGGMTDIAIIASGGVASLPDVTSLARIDALSGAVIGKALHECVFTLAEARARASAARSVCDRVIPCLDIRGGRVVKGVRFEELRDAGDPVECARRYEEEGADEVVLLDVSATLEERRASIETVQRVSGAIFIPLTVGGGVRSVGDFATLIRSGADRVAINTAAFEEPSLIGACAAEFGSQAVVLACDARRARDGWRVVVRSGKCDTPLDAAEWCAEAENRGAGEVLLTSIDRDGTREGFDLALLRKVTSKLRIGVIASGGAGEPEHFAEAIEIGGAQAVLAAGVFHDRELSVGEVKEYLGTRGVPVR